MINAPRVWGRYKRVAPQLMDRSKMETETTMGTTIHKDCGGKVKEKDNGKAYCYKCEERGEIE